MKALEEIVCVTKSEDGDGPPGCSCVQRAHQTLAAREDKKYGGFASAPKFPQPGMYNGCTHKVNERIIGMV